METKTTAFKFKKEIGLGTALSLIGTAFFAVAVWVFNTSATTQNNTEEISEVKKQVTKNTDTVYNLQKEIQKEMKEDKKELNEKLDRIMHVLIDK